MQHNQHTTELYGVIESRLSTIRVLLYDIAENCESETLRDLGIAEAYKLTSELEEWCSSLKSMTSRVNSQEGIKDK